MSKVTWQCGMQVRVMHRAAAEEGQAAVPDLPQRRAELHPAGV